MSAVLTAELDQLIRFGSAHYDYHLRLRNDSAGLRRRLAELDTDRFILVTDKKVPGHHVDRMRSRAAAVAPCTTLVIDAGERAKTLAGIEDLAVRALRDGASRRSVVIGFGGGLPGNVAGLLAHVFMRGVRLVHIPTTLLAMSDSVLSLKQAVNTSEGKNQIGGFHAPQFVWADLDYLKSLPPAEIRSALCEMIKNVLAIAPDHYDWAAVRLQPDARYTQWTLASFITFCIEAKQKVMAEDEHETGRALALEYGHTVGHAIELLTPGGMSHGLAIGLGMLAEARVSRELGFLGADAERAHRVLLERAGVPVELPFRTPGRDFLGLFHRDNKRGYRPPEPGTVDMILLDELGSVHRESGTYVTRVPDDTAIRGVSQLLPPLPPRPRVSTAVAFQAA